MGNRLGSLLVNSNLQATALLQIRKHRNGNILVSVTLPSLLTRNSKYAWHQFKHGQWSNISQLTGGAMSTKDHLNIRWFLPFSKGKCCRGTATSACFPHPQKRQACKQKLLILISYYLESHREVLGCWSCLAEDCKTVSWWWSKGTWAIASQKILLDGQHHFIMWMLFEPASAKCPFNMVAIICSTAHRWDCFWAQNCSSAWAVKAPLRRLSHASPHDPVNV